MTTKLEPETVRMILKALGKHCQHGSVVMTGFALSDMTGIPADVLFQYGLENPNIYRPETRENDPAVYFFINEKHIPALIANAAWTHNADGVPERNNKGELRECLVTAMGSFPVRPYVPEDKYFYDGGKGWLSISDWRKGRHYQSPFEINITHWQYAAAPPEPYLEINTTEGSR